jgi:hypothetical protein
LIAEIAEDAPCGLAKSCIVFEHDLRSPRKLAGFRRAVEHRSGFLDRPRERD